MKKKNKKYGKYIIAATLSMCTLGMGATLLIKNNYAQTKAYSNDDTLYKITLTATEVNNNTFNNLVNYFNEYVSGDDVTALNTALAGSTITYGPNTLNFNTTFTDASRVQFRDPTFYINFYIGTTYGANKLGTFDLNSLSTGPVSITESVVLNLNEETYENVNIAIQKDLGIYVEPEHDMGEDILSSITSGLGIIGDLAQEFLLGFGALFYANNQLTDFAIFGLVMLGIAISFAIVKLILSIIRSNTGV